MCLSKAELIKPNKDLTSYKICKVYDKNLNIYVSEYKAFPYTLGKLKTIKRKKPDTYFYTNTDIGLTIEGNAFHSFKTLQAARAYYKRLLDKNNFVIIKCTIPQDSKFIYEGEYYAYHDKSYKAYASHQLLPLCVVK